MEESLNVDWCIVILLEAIIEDGNVVAEHHWDSGGPGAGAGVVSVYKYRGCYFGLNDVAWYGPFDTLDPVFEKLGILTPTDATTSIKIFGQVYFDAETSFASVDGTPLNEVRSEVGSQQKSTSTNNQSEPLNPLEEMANRLAEDLRASGLPVRELGPLRMNGLHATFVPRRRPKLEEPKEDQ